MLNIEELMWNEFIKVVDKVHNDLPEEEFVKWAYINKHWEDDLDFEELSNLKDVKRYFIKVYRNHRIRDINETPRYVYRLALITEKLDNPICNVILQMIRVSFVTKKLYGLNSQEHNIARSLIRLARKLVTNQSSRIYGVTETNELIIKGLCDDFEELFNECFEYETIKVKNFVQTFTSIIDTLLTGKEIELHYVIEDELTEQTEECTKIINCKNEDKEVKPVLLQDKYTEYSDNNSDSSLTETAEKYTFCLGETSGYLRLNNLDSNDLYFKSKAEKYIFYLLELDGRLRLNKLAINKLHYAKKEVATKWKDEIQRILDKSKHPYKDKAIKELEEMYKEMVS